MPFSRESSGNQSLSLLSFLSLRERVLTGQSALVTAKKVLSQRAVIPRRHYGVLEAYALLL
jgi:hypothetical protein